VIPILGACRSATDPATVFGNRNGNYSNPEELRLRRHHRRRERNRETLFPGAPRPQFSSSGGNLAEQVLAAINELPLATQSIRAAELGKAVNREWGKISKALLTPGFKPSAGAIGWEYTPGKGRSGSRFERLAGEYGCVADSGCG
jgi:hypothetical protein